MRVIYKYPLRVVNKQHFDMYADSEIIGVQVQDNDIVMWAVVDTDRKMIEVAIRMYGTGEEFADEIDDLSFISTVQLGSFVWHLFMVSKVRDEDMYDDDND